VLQVIPMVASAFCIFGSELYTTLGTTLIVVNSFYGSLLFHVNSYVPHIWLAFYMWLLCMYPHLMVTFAITLHALSYIYIYIYIIHFLYCHIVGPATRTFLI